MNFKVRVIIDPPVPERIGSFSMNLKKNFFESAKLPLEECDEDSKRESDEYWRPRLGYDIGSPQQDLFYTMLCLDEDKAFIQGDATGI